jgi:hypothetical protein
MESIFQSLYRPFVWLVVILFIIIYPMLISVYVFLPLFIGIMGYFFLRGIDEGKYQYLFVSSFYFINLEVNLSLPLFLTIISFLLVYVLFYQNLNYFRRCQVCKPILSVILLDIFYLGMLLSYDFIFQTSSVVLDNLLLYSLIVDMLVVVIL